jgi:uncharacterized protein (DUF934 family)
MPRQLLRDRLIVADDWVYAGEWPAAAGDAAPAAHAGGGQAPEGLPPRVILGLDQWLAERDAWIARAVHLGVVLSPEHKVEQLAPDLERLSLVACSFSGPSEGRGYTQGRLLRERYDFQGELRATGYVRIDQLFFLARCGFNSFELADADLGAAAAAFSTFTAAYQPANDRGLGRKLQHP